jgi:DNA repair protein RadC
MESGTVQPAWTKVAEVELVYKTTVKASERPQIKSSSETYEILREVWDKSKLEFQEEFKVLLLNRANKVLGLYALSIGGLTGTMADPRLVMAAAVKSLSVAIILCHNHPSGNLKPSKADEELTQKIKAAACLLDIKVLDHIIITSEGYYSFADEGLL